MKKGIQKRFGLAMNGMLWQTMNSNTRSPTNPPNGPGSLLGGLFLYQANNYMFNWLRISVAHQTSLEKHDWDWGFNVDLVYRTDYIALGARGLV